MSYSQEFFMLAMVASLGIMNDENRSWMFFLFIILSIITAVFNA